MTTHGTVRKMTDGQKGDILATMVGAIPADFSFDEAQAIIGAKGPFVAEIRELFRRRRMQPQLQFLKFIGTIAIKATAEPFVARENFVVGANRKGHVKIVWLGGSFKEWFLGKNEELVQETTLRYAKLVNSSVDGPILAELGDKAETALAQVFALMERQANGEEGVLLLNGSANIFYVLDIKDELRAVGVSWVGSGWRVVARSVTNLDGRLGGCRVFSRNS